GYEIADALPSQVAEVVSRGGPADQDQDVPAGMLLGPADASAAVDRGEPHARRRRLAGDLWWQEVGIEPACITLEGRQRLRFGVVGSQAAAADQRGGALVLLADQLEEFPVQRIGVRWHHTGPQPTTWLLYQNLLSGQRHLAVRARVDAHNHPRSLHGGPLPCQELCYRDRPIFERRRAVGKEHGR